MLDPDHETRRVAALRSFEILDSPPEERFDRVLRSAARLFGSPIALLSLVDQDRQWFKAAIGLDVRETPRSMSFCAHAIRQSGVFVIPDARLDSRFADNVLVTGPPYIRFYAGAPLVTSTGEALGTLCIIDREPWSELPAFAAVALADYAGMVMDWLEVDRTARRLRRELAALNQTSGKSGAK